MKAFSALRNTSRSARSSAVGALSQSRRRVRRPTSGHLLGVALLCRPGLWLAENIGPQLVARDGAVSGLLDRDAALGGYARPVATLAPVAYGGLADAELFGQRRDAAHMGDCFIERVHGVRSSRFVFHESTPIVLDGGAPR